MKNKLLFIYNYKKITKTKTILNMKLNKIYLLHIYKINNGCFFFWS